MAYKFVIHTKVECSNITFLHSGNNNVLYVESSRFTHDNLVVLNKTSCYRFIKANIRGVANGNKNFIK